MTLHINNFKHVLWDWNGTLFNDAWLCVDIINILLSRRNLKPVTMMQYQEDFTFPVINFYKKVGFDFDKESFEALADEYMVIYHQRRFECKLNDDAVTVLEEFKKRGVTQSILSAYQHTMLEEAVTYFGIKPYFSHIVGLNDYYAQSKIENGKNLIARFESDKSKIVIIGDTTHDFEVAREIGINCILLNGGHYAKHRLIACNTRVVENLKDILYL